MSDGLMFTIGPPLPVTDSRLLPAVTAPDEAGFVHGADVGKHPDNRPLQAGELDVAGVAADAAVATDEVLPLAAELDGVVAGLDVDAVDEVGFDPTDGGFGDNGIGDNGIGDGGVGDGGVGDGGVDDGGGV